MIRKRVDCAAVSLRKCKMSGNMKSLYHFLYTCAGCRGTGMVERRGIKGRSNAGIVDVEWRSWVEVEPGVQGEFEVEC